MIICIDGPNGVGKTTIIEKLKKIFSNALYIDDITLKENLDENNNFMEARKKIENKYFETTKLIFIVRWTVSMFVFDYYDDKKDIFEKENTLITPDITYVIISNKENIEKRISDRKNFKLELDINQQIEKYINTANLFGNKILINNNMDDLNNIIKKISTDVKKLLE